MQPGASAGISSNMSYVHHISPFRPAVPGAKMAERLRAHARLCQQIAHESWNETIAGELNRLADQCLAAADNIDSKVPPHAQLH